jgi:hypothetical protein
MDRFVMSFALNQSEILRLSMGAQSPSQSPNTAEFWTSEFGEGEGLDAVVVRQVGFPNFAY